MFAPTPVTVRRTFLGMEVSATPHLAFPEGERIAAQLVAAAAPLIKLGGATFKVADKDGNRKAVSLQDLAVKAGVTTGKINPAVLLDALSSLDMDDLIGALVAAVKGLFLEDPRAAEQLQLDILANTSVVVPTAAGGRTSIALNSRDTIGQVVGTSYKRLFALLAFQLEVSYADFFDSLRGGGQPATAPPSTPTA
jgi:hypothetical protein